MDEMTEDHLYGWLRARGYSDGDAGHLIARICADGPVVVQIPQGGLS